MKTLRLFLFISILTVASTVSYAQLPDGYESGLETITADEILHSITFFANDSMKGRPSGSEEELLAAIYIANKFKLAGVQGYVPVRYGGKEKDAIMDDAEIELSDAHDFKTYFQKFNFVKSVVSDDCELTLHQQNEESSITTAFDFGVDFGVQFKGVRNLEMDAPLIFAGYGIDNGPNGYNDYLLPDGNEIDVEGKIVIIVDGYPQQDDENSLFNVDKKPNFSNNLRKAETAAKKGALAVIVVSNPNRIVAPVMITFDHLTGGFKKADYHLPRIKRSQIPIFFASEMTADELFVNTSVSLADVLTEIETSLKPTPQLLTSKRIHCKVAFDNELLQTQNVVGFIEGSDPELKDEVIVVCGHYDHVGTGEYGAMNQDRKGEIHNGADDNASGTAGVIEIAEALAKNPPKRSVIFIAFAAEENGLLGSKYYAYVQPIVPLEKTVAVINLDMISRNAPELVWIGGAFHSYDIPQVVREANVDIGMELLYNVGMLGGASDQGPFLHKGIPAAFFFTGMHDEYHTPDDDIELVNPQKAAKVTKLAYLTVWHIANTLETPKFERVSMDDRVNLVKESLKRQRKFEKNSK